MTCSRCRADNPERHRFCSACGAPLAPACPACGFGSQPNARFCGGCGRPLAPGSPRHLGAPDTYTPKHPAEQILTSRSAREGERKQVTILFADMKGSLEALADLRMAAAAYREIRMLPALERAETEIRGA